MEQLTKFMNDALEGFKSLHLLARLVKIGPRHMISFKKHTAYNTSALALISILLIASINMYAPVAEIGLATGLLSAVVSLAFIGLVGFLVNLVEPADDVFVSEGMEDNVTALTNKWASYFALNFVTLILAFLLVNGLFSAASSEGRPAVGWLVAHDYNYDFAVWLVLGFCSICSTTFVFTFCKMSNKIVDSWRSASFIFLVTNLVCSSLFYFLHYHMFG